MNKKKIIILIVLSLLLAGGILFILLHPVEDTTPTEPNAPTEGTVETGAPATESSIQTEPDDADNEETAAQTEAPATEEPTEIATEAEPAEPKPSETKPAEPEPEETEPTEPKSTDPDDYDNTGSNIGASTEPVLTGDSEYERYMNMSAEDQEAYFNSFDSPAEFFDWYNKAKQEYEESRDVIEVGPDATIDLGDIGN